MKKLSTLLIILSGCSLLNYNQNNETETTPSISSLELTISRYSLTGAEFEHYKLDHGKLFWECGGMRRNRFNPKEQEFTKISSDKEKRIKFNVAKLTDAMETSESDWQPAGKLTSLTDPGEIKLNVTSSNKPFEIVTSLDSVSTPTTKKEQMLQKTVNAVRSSLTKAPCNNKTFYGFSNILE